MRQNQTSGAGVTIFHTDKQNRIANVNIVFNIRLSLT
jgi:hypothetical protein